MVTTNGRSFRFDSRDIVHSVAVWRSPDMINVVFGNLMGLAVFGFLIYLGICFSKNTEKVNKVHNYIDQCKLQMMSAGQKVDERFCVLSSRVRVNNESSK